MITRGICRKIAALAVAYVIAIQAVITGLLPVSPAAADFRGVLCSTLNSAVPELPGQSVPQHDGIICCLATACSSPTIAVQDVHDSAEAADRRYFVAIFAVVSPPPNEWPSERPRSSRAPPV